MLAIERALEQRLAPQGVPLAVVLPGGRRLGSANPAVTLRLHELAPLAHLATGQIGRVAEAYVEGRLDIDGSMRDLMFVAAQLVGDAALASDAAAPLTWWSNLTRTVKSRVRHQLDADARQIQFHYDVSDDFYALWLDERRVYSCAYWKDPAMTLDGAQAAKLDHICRKLMLREGERFLDIGAGWGGLLLWAAEHYGVRADGITLSKNQHAHVNRLIDERGLRGRVTMNLCDYRDLPEAQPYDSIASVGMFEHVGRANLPVYFHQVLRLLKPGGLLMNHGITAGGTRNHQLGAGMGDFIERYIFPGGELMHASHVLKVMSESGLEPVDVENLRPHYARTLWAWSDRLEAQLAKARELTRESVVRAYRLYLAGSAMSFEQGWISLQQMLATHPDHDMTTGNMRGAQSRFPFNREYIYR
ncbi:cyclopropane-fatty-acyl-phospholipid synthase family protein [Rhizobacter sp. J219]|jgi:cyclopropane-fatty-acyl-phospholipid synthase|uniref:SAM-dependent methyltransferase n=1 Tax=Rhizobacter sp. J219 TaxID=2898430 RepID=UPI002151E63A|nr:cyclopropane-fatty-acyl-phospholipid synthase family protein [Rhizobacter sp. J219]MCR5885134.1 cyclopropane-fatty-acyl-phospholipid synthase family protein [Rhizobacter sp. J219]